MMRQSLVNLKIAEFLGKGGKIVKCRYGDYAVTEEDICSRYSRNTPEVKLKNIKEKADSWRSKARKQEEQAGL